MTNLIQARYWEQLETGKLHCTLCPVGCRLSENQTGICLGRTNVNGKLLAVNYGEVVSMAVDPIEKKPLYHFYPGSKILSVGPNGCNLRCDNCQNWEIAQEVQATRYVSPKQLVETAQAVESIGIAYTYSEPLIWFEYIYDVAALSREKGLKTVLVSNGYINEAPFRELAPCIDAMNIDVKSIRPDFYRKICKGTLESVIKTVEIAAASEMFLEITYLVITDLNDSDDDFHALVDWLSGIDRKIPLHFSRYFPHHKLDNAATPTDRLQRAYAVAKEKLDYVYVGNIDIRDTSDTLCPQCRNVLISRRGYHTFVEGIKEKRCVKCSREVDIRL